MSTMTSSVSQTFSATTKDGRGYHLDMVYDNVVGKYLLRTDQVGMKIIREIHADRKRSVAVSDSLMSLNTLYKQVMQECDDQVSILLKDKIDLSKQLDINNNMLDNEVENLRLADETIKQLKRKATTGRIMTIAGGVCIVGSVGAILASLILN